LVQLSLASASYYFLRPLWCSFWDALEINPRMVDELIN